MVDVFISYSRADQALVRQLADAVKREGYEIWWDDELPPHLSYGDVITEKIGAARAAIVVWSHDAAASEWVRAEADVARNQKKLIQTSIDERMPPMPFNQIQFAQIGDWRGEDDHPGWMKVKASLRALCGAAAGAASPAPPRAPPAPAPLPTPPPRSLMVPMLIGLLILAVLIVFYMAWPRGRDETDPYVAGSAAPSAASRDAAAPAPGPATTDNAFTGTATVEAAAEVRGGPSPQAFVVGRVGAGESVATYPQDGDWWRVRTANGTIGYLPRLQLRLARDDVVPAPTPAPRAAASKPAPREQPPRARRPDPGATPNQGAVRRYCMGPGRGTPECRRLRRRLELR